MDNEDKLYYKQVLQGLSEELPDEFFKLAQLVEVEQLEFLAPKDNSNNSDPGGCCCRSYGS